MRNETNDTLNRRLAEFHRADAQLHMLRNTFPTGMRSIDDKRDTVIKALTETVKELQQTITRLRSELRGQS